MIQLPFRQSLRRIPSSHFFSMIRSMRRWERPATDGVTSGFVSSVRMALLTGEFQRRVWLVDVMEGPDE